MYYLFIQSNTSYDNCINHNNMACGSNKEENEDKRDNLPPLLVSS